MDVGIPIAQRVLELESAAGAKREVTLRIGAPRRADVDWLCPFEIVDGAEQRVEAAAGADSLQALELAMQMAELVLNDMARAEGGRVLWLGKGPMGG